MDLKSAQYSLINVYGDNDDDNNKDRRDKHDERVMYMYDWMCFLYLTFCNSKFSAISPLFVYLHICCLSWCIKFIGYSVVFTLVSCNLHI